MGKNPPPMLGDVGSILDQKEPLEEEMVIHSCILAWEISWTKEPGGAIVHGVTKEAEQLSN